MIFRICQASRCHSLEGTFCHQAPRSNSLSDELAIYSVQKNDTVNPDLRHEMERAISTDMQKRLCACLHQTSDVLQSEYPDEDGDVTRHQLRSHSDLSDLAGIFDEIRAGIPGNAGISGHVVTSASLDNNLAQNETAPTPIVRVPRSHSTAESYAAFAASLMNAESNKAADDGAAPSLENAKALAHEGLLDHEQLIGTIYASQGLNLSAIQSQARDFLKSLGLRPVDLGVANVDENGQQLLNQCFYLTLARGYLGHIAPPEVLALRLRMAIEASVIAARPAWAHSVGLGTSTDVGVMAFADFLPIAMQAEALPGKRNILSELVVCILDSVGGHVEVYIGPNYNKLEDPSTQERNLILLLYSPGHYQCLVRDDDDGSKFYMTYTEFKSLLTKNGVVYIETRE